MCSVYTVYTKCPFFLLNLSLFPLQLLAFGLLTSGALVLTVQEPLFNVSLLIGWNVNPLAIFSTALVASVCLSAIALIGWAGIFKEDPFILSAYSTSLAIFLVFELSCMTFALGIKDRVRLGQHI